MFAHSVYACRCVYVSNELTQPIGYLVTVELTVPVACIQESFEPGNYRKIAIISVKMTTSNFVCLKNFWANNRQSGYWDTFPFKLRPCRCDEIKLFSYVTSVLWWIWWNKKLPVEHNHKRQNRSANIVAIVNVKILRIPPHGPILTGGIHRSPVNYTHTHAHREGPVMGRCGVSLSKLLNNHSCCRKSS